MSARRSPVVVTGAAGNLGTRLVAHLEATGREVRAVDLRDSGRPGAVVDDLTAPGDRPWLAGAAAVVHLAGLGVVGASWAEVEGPNVAATRVLVAAARSAGVPRFVLASSVWAMRDRWEAGGVVPAGPAQPGERPYGRSKAAAEEIVRTAVDDGMSAVVLRIGGRVPGNAPPRRLGAWEDACWLGWDDFLRGVDRALDAAVAGCVTVNLVSDNPAGRWSLREGRDLIGYRPRQRFRPVPAHGSVLSRVRTRLARWWSRSGA